jgi:hypothetical protein
MTTKRPNIKSKNRHRAYRRLFQDILNAGVLSSYLEEAGKIKTACGSRYEAVAKEELGIALSSGNPQQLSDFIYSFIRDSSWQALTRGSIKGMLSKSDREKISALAREISIASLADEATKDGYEKK